MFENQAVAGYRGLSRFFKARAERQEKKFIFSQLSIKKGSLLSCPLKPAIVALELAQILNGRHVMMQTIKKVLKKQIPVIGHNYKLEAFLAEVCKAAPPAGIVHQF